LPLLEPFRDASGRSPSRRLRYRASPYGQWLRLSWRTLDWQGLLPARALESDDPPINPQPHPQASRRARALALLTRPSRGWPFVHIRHHWFVEAPSPSLSLSRRWMPPWLARLDPHYALALLAIHHCEPATCSSETSFPAFAARAIWEALDPPMPPSPWWECREREVAVMRYGREREVFVPLHCDGSVPDDALEILSQLARPPGVSRPDGLPDEPQGDGKPGEWVPGVRLLHPRLLWVLHRLAQANPWKGIYIYSGYRPSEEPLTEGSHVSQHALGRALDMRVEGLSNEELLAACWDLPDVFCGYYPNHDFVHVDVRPRGSGKGVWVDDSQPGEPSRFVAEWPGVVENGAVVYEPER
jgi:hypothetical protein